jgi:hypothetical protein
MRIWAPRQGFVVVAALALAGPLAGGQGVAARSKPRHTRLRSNATRVVVARGQSVQIAFTADNDRSPGLH